MKHTPRFVILAWHSVNILGNEYHHNDLLAFSRDLKTIDETGCTILPLNQALDGLARGTLDRPTVVLTSDDGPVTDFEDMQHPEHGPQKGLFGRMQAFLDANPREEHRLHLTSLAIASPDARMEIDRKDFLGLDLWHDRWWRAARKTGLISIENHSWDHNHASLDQSCQRNNDRGTFRNIETPEECRAEVDQASDYIEQTTGQRPRFFGYPYGESSDYLRQEYLPRFGPGLGLKAALACEPEPVHPESDPWHLPRFVCGQDWSQPDELTSVLKEIT